MQDFIAVDIANSRQNPLIKKCRFNRPASACQGPTQILGAHPVDNWIGPQRDQLGQALGEVLGAECHHFPKSSGVDETKLNWRASHRRNQCENHMGMSGTI
jgi:hypothetical protein